MTAFISRLLALAAVFILGFQFGFVSRDLDPRERGPEDWVAYARANDLKPCWSDVVLVRLHNLIVKEGSTLSEEEKAEAIEDGRVITSGHHKDIVVPKNCFAVGDGRYAFTVTFWQRPYQNGEFDMSIPYWNPHPDPYPLG
jgi:hypothetical protein